MKLENYYILIYKELEGYISDSELIELQKWIESSEKNRTIYLDCKKLWETFEITEEPEFNVAAQWEKLQNGIKKTKNNSILLQLIKVAAVILLVVSSVFYLTDLFSNSFELIKNQTEQVQKYTLPDNSVVFLNINAELKYNVTKSKRNIKLNGEAYFEVEKGEAPFIIETKNSFIKVVGTKFLVDSKNKKTKLVVTEGIVEFGNKNKKFVTVTKDHVSICENQNPPSKPERIITIKELEWLCKPLTFKNMYLRDVLAKLEKRFNVKYYLLKKSLGLKRLTAEFRNESLETIHSALSSALNISLTKKKGKYYISEIK